MHVAPAGDAEVVPDLSPSKVGSQTMFEILAASPKVVARSPDDPMLHSSLCQHQVDHMEVAAGEAALHSKNQQ